MNLLLVVIQRILKGYVKVIILLTLNRSKTLIKCVVLGVLFTCVLVGLSSSPIFAASEDPLSSEVSSDFNLVVPEEYKDPVYDKLASGDVRAAYDVNDVYLLLNNYFKGSLYNSSEDINSVFPLVRISYYLRQFFDDYVDGMGPQGYGFFEQASDSYMVIQNQIPLIYSTLAQVHGDGQNNSYYLSEINSKLSSSWFNISNSYSYTRTSPSGSNLTSDFWQTNFYCYFTGLNSVDNSNPNVFRFLVPIRTYDYLSDLSQVLTDFNVYILRNSQLYEIPIDLSDVYFETTYHGTYVYFFGFDISDYLNDVVLHFTTSQNVKYYNSNSAVVSYLPFNTYYAQILKTAFYQESTSKSFGEISSYVDRLAKYLADPDKIAAEEASQQVIDDTLDGFTGNGSAAVKTSDTGGMKNMSGSIQSGLDTGASASNAASVFSNTTFWSWFTQDNSNKINQPYPAPVVPQTRGSGDEIVDFLSGNQAELSELLNQRNSW